MINNLTIVVVIVLFSFLLAAPFVLQSQQAYGKDAYGQGYAAGALYGGQDNSRDYEEPGEYYNDYDENSIETGVNEVYYSFSCIQNLDSENNTGVPLSK